jgi:hypothetical protein
LAGGGEKDRGNTVSRFVDSQDETKNEKPRRENFSPELQVLNLNQNMNTERKFESEQKLMPGPCFDGEMVPVMHPCHKRAFLYGLNQTRA